MSHFHLGQLRHLYQHMVQGTFNDPKELAEGLLSPAIAALERDTESYNSTIEHLKSRVNNLESEIVELTEIIDCLQSKED